MMSKDEIRKMTVPQLRQLIRQHNVRGYSSMKKEQLVDIIHKKQQTTKRNLKPQLPLDVVVNRALTAKEERVRKKKFQQKKRGPTKLAPVLGACGPTTHPLHLSHLAASGLGGCCGGLQRGRGCVRRLVVRI